MAWAEQAMRRLGEAGYRSGGSRRQVVELLGGESCAVTALEIDRRLDEVGRASVYRTLEQLEQLHLVQRVEIGGDAAGYERVDPELTITTSSARSAARLAPFASDGARGGDRGDQPAAPSSRSPPTTSSCAAPARAADAGGR